MKGVLYYVAYVNKLSRVFFFMNFTYGCDEVPQ